ncbi:MAG TPA: hypothetical protein VL137_15090 [Polyangiaceae bacterium]|jgi:hypothetical protein|nr:hypothetical protein [Polyangiaceae bacterium]
MSSTKYRSFEDFTRDEIRPGMRAGWCLDNISDPGIHETDFDLDPFEAALLEAELEDEDDEFDSEE